jgi:hypothetical protein
MPSAPPGCSWWEAGRPDTEQALSLQGKRSELPEAAGSRSCIEAVWDYCDRHGLQAPQPLHHRATGRHQDPAHRSQPRLASLPRPSASSAASPSARTIRWPGLHRLRLHDRALPVRQGRAGRLLNDPFDPRCTEWLVEIPTEVSWANLPGCRCGGDQQFLGSWPSSTSTCRCRSTTRPTTPPPPSSFARTRSNAGRGASTRPSKTMRATSRRPCWPASMPFANLPPAALRTDRQGHLRDLPNNKHCMTHDYGLRPGLRLTQAARR